MATRIPNPCEGVVEEARCREGFSLVDGQCVPDERPPEVPPFTGSFSPADAEPIFVQRTIQMPTARAGRSLTMIDEEYFNISEVPFGHSYTYDDQDSVYTPAWYYSQKVQQNIIRDPRDNESRDYVHLDPFRAGLLFVWGYYRSDAENAGFDVHYFSNTAPDPDPENYSIPVTTTFAGPPQQNLNHEDQPATSTIVLTFTDNDRTRSLTNNYSSFDGDHKKFYGVYLNGENSTAYQRYPTGPQRQMNKYKYGVLPTPGSIYCDSVFDHPLPFHQSESDFLNIPSCNVVDISLVNRGFQTEGLGLGKIISEYQKPSIYRSFFEEEKLKTLELNELEGGCIPQDRIQKFPSAQVENFSAANTKLEKQSESYVRIKIMTPQAQGLIAELLKNSKMDRHVLDLMTTDDERYMSNRELFAQITNDIVDVPGGGMGDLFTDNDRASHGIFTKVNNEFKKKILDQGNYAGGTRIQDISEYPLGYHNYDKPFLLSFEDAITSRIFFSELTDYVKHENRSRTFNEILSGRKAHSEIIAFHVEKADAITGEVIQDFYFSDSNDVLEIDFIDNQVLLGKKYRYRVFAVNMVLATEYTYGHPHGFTDASDPEPAGGFFITNLPVRSTLKYSIIETPYYEKIVSIFDKPPMFPEVSFLPYQGVEDEIAFLLQSNGGEVLEMPIPIKSEDSESFEAMANAQGKAMAEELLYGTDDLPTGFQLLCMQGPEPTKYSDFSEAEVKSFDAHGKTGFYKLKIKPNEYYYAIFRTVEGDMISNPTEVYRFMMVSYENGIYFDVQTIEMEQPIEMPVISFEKILKIHPQPEHMLLNIAPESDSPTDVTNFNMSAPELTLDKIGREDNTLWGKKLKIRLRSRTTGKELDIKLVFEKQLKTLGTPPAETQSESIPTVCDT